VLFIKIAGFGSNRSLVPASPYLIDKIDLLLLEIVKMSMRKETLG
jgi:hypothetical protein